MWISRWIKKESFADSDGEESEPVSVCLPYDRYSFSEDCNVSGDGWQIGERS